MYLQIHVNTRFSTLSKFITQIYYKSKMLIQKYQTSWADYFLEIKKVINSSLLNLDIRIEHIGSTSVPKLAAKPIIDIDIVYSSNVKFETIKNGLVEIGYFHNGNQGIEDREVFKRKELNQQHEILDLIIHHLYVCPHYSEEFHRHIMFRDFLRKNKMERKQYEELKLQIAKEANQNRKVYAKIKETKARDFIESILKKAQNADS